MIYTFTANPSLDKLYELKQLNVGEYNRGRIIQHDPGGKGINVSRCLKEIGDESTIVGFFAGSTGEYLIENLKSDGFKVISFICEGETRSNLTVTESINNRMTKLNELGPVASFDVMDLLLCYVKQQTKMGDVWVLSGSLPPGLPNGFYAILIKQIQASGGLAFLDTSQMWLMYGCQAAPYCLRVNKKEAETALGSRIVSDQDVQNALRSFCGIGILLAVISLDKNGAVFNNREQMIYAEAPSVAVNTTVGAGDAMMSMIVHGFNRKWTLEKIARWSVAAGTASVMGKGTSPAEMKLVANLVNQVNVRVIETQDN